MQEVSILDKIDYGAKGESEIIQNVRFILSTIADSCVMHRKFGLDGDSVDAPIDYAKAQLTLSCIEAVERNEPRAQVVSVEFDTDALSGLLIPKAKVVILDGTIQST